MKIAGKINQSCILLSLFKFVAVKTCKVKLVIILLLPVIFLIACTDNTPAWEKPEKQDGVYFDYKIRGEESDSNVTVYIQYKMGGPGGDAFLLTEPAHVQLDGETIYVDSARLTGAFYEIQKPAYSFVGKHTILFTDENKKEHKEEFEYDPFYLEKELPAVVNRGDLAFDFRGLKKEDHIRISATDTSFMSKDIIEIDTVKNNKLVIPADKLRNLVDGPIVLLVTKETEKMTKDGIRGRVVVSYGFEREFELITPQ